MKAILWILLLVVLVVGGAGAYLYFNSGALLKGAIEEYGSEAVGVPVRVGSVELSLTDGVGELRNFTVANPPGYGSGHVMSIGLTRLGLNVQESTEQLVVLSELVVDAAALNVIAKGKDTNVQALQEQMAGSSSGGSTASDSGGTPAPKVIVDRLRITNTSSNVTSDILGETTLNVPDVRLDNVGRAEGGITFEELANRIVSPITRDVTRELLNKGLGVDEAKAKAKEKIQSELDKGLKSLTDRLKINRD